MFSRYIYHIAAILWLSAAIPAHALTMAVFPIEDLSQGYNGVNSEVTDYLAWQMDNRGFDVIANDSVIAFMGRNKVRWLGYLDTRQILLAQDELGADLILFGTTSVTQKDIYQSLAQSLGLTLYLVRTSDAKTLWTGSSGLSQQDMVTLLDIGAPEDDALPALLVQRVLEEWPQDLNFTAKQQHALEIESIELDPSYLTRGEKVSCRVILSSNWSEEDSPRVFFKAAGRVHRAEESKNGIFKSEWEAVEQDGRYTVTMVINWPSGHKKVAFLGAYNIDSAPPQIVLDLKGIKLQGTVAFRDQVIIIPRMLRREPVARWRLTVEDEKGEEQLSHLGHGQLPRRFVWDGKAASGWPAAEGVYRVTLQVWDQAENMAVAYQPVAVARTPPTMILEAKNRGRDMLVDLSHEGKVPIAFWRMEMRSSGGELIKVAEGDDLPVRMDLRLPYKGIKVADEGPSQTIKVADGLAPPSDGNTMIRVAKGPDGKLVLVDDGKKGKLIRVAEGQTGRLIKVAENPDGKLVKVAESQSGKFVRVAESQIGGLIRVVEGQDGKLIWVTGGQGGKTIKVAEGNGGSGNVIRVAEDHLGNKVIRVADGPESNKKVIKVADGPGANKKVIKVADGPGANKKVLKVADVPVSNKKIFKVADAPVYNDDTIMVVAGKPLHLDALEPSEKETRRVECTVIMRDVLGNVVRKRVDDIEEFAKELEDARRKAIQPVVEEAKPSWLEDF